MVFWGPHARNLDGRIKVEASQLEARCGQTKALRNMIYNWVVAKSRLNDSIKKLLHVVKINALIFKS